MASLVLLAQRYHNPYFRVRATGRSAGFLALNPSLIVDSRGRLFEHDVVSSTTGVEYSLGEQLGLRVPGYAKIGAAAEYRLHRVRRDLTSHCRRAAGVVDRNIPTGSFVIQCQLCG